MRGKVDENMPIESAGVLRTAGWECDTVFDEALSGAEDPDVGARCQAEGRVLFTLDTDFADIRAYPPSAYAGIVVFRPAKPSRDSAGTTEAFDSRTKGRVGRASAMDR
jgi:hypothetical protein